MALVVTGAPVHPPAAYDWTCQPPPAERATTWLERNEAPPGDPWWLCSAQRPIATTLAVASSVGAAIPALHAEVLDHARNTIQSDARVAVARRNPTAVSTARVLISFFATSRRRPPD